MRARKEALRGGMRPRQVSSLHASSYPQSRADTCQTAVDFASARIRTSCACNDADGCLKKFKLPHAQSKQQWHGGPRLRCDELCGGLEERFMTQKAVG